MKVNGHGRGEWRGRPIASTLLRAAVLLVPVAASTAAGVTSSRLIIRPTGPAEVAWWAAVLGISILVLVATDAFARRLLPLATLLRLSLVFPDRAPSRFAVAFRTRNLRTLRAWADAATEEAAETGRDPQEVAERATSILALAAALNAHDRRTRGHSERVRVLSLLVAEELNLSDDDRAALGWAAFLHDIGKLSVPVEILNKAGTPDDREWEVLKRHPSDGARIAVPLEGWLGEWIGAIGEHHERFDGSGYPDGLAGDDISLAGRIVSVTDSFETMTATRAYKKPMTAAAARAELTRCAGSHFDPRVVRAFLGISLGRLTWTLGVAAFLAQLPFLLSVRRAGAVAGRVLQPTRVYGGATAGVTSALVGLSLSLFVTGGPSTGGDRAAASPPGGSVVRPALDAAPTGLSATGVERSQPRLESHAPAFVLVPVPVPAPSPVATDERLAGPENGGGAQPVLSGGQPDHSHPHGGPPGQADKDWSTHPHAGPPGQQVKEWWQA